MWIKLSMLSGLLATLAALALFHGNTSVSAQHEHLRNRNLAVVEVPQAAVEQRLLNNAKSLWYSRYAKFGSYRYNFWQRCDSCDSVNFPWRVQMTGGSPAKAVDTNNSPRAGALSIAQTFDKIQAAITKPSDSVLATYDETFGYPNTYRIDYGSASDLGVVTSSVYGLMFENGSPQEQLTEHRTVWNSQNVRDYDFTYYVDGPNPHNIQWPLSVKVRNGSPVETRDRNGNVVGYLVPQTFDQYFDMIQRQLDKSGTFVDNDYSKRGFAREIFMFTDDVGEINYHFCSFKDAVA